MTELARSYDFSDPRNPRIGDTVIPWHIAACGPRVALLDPSKEPGDVHVLWLPVIIAAPMPQVGEPDGTAVTDLEEPRS